MKAWKLVLALLLALIIMRTRPGAGPESAR